MNNGAWWEKGRESRREFCSGWWFQYCGSSNLNGEYKAGCAYQSPGNTVVGIWWQTWPDTAASPTYAPSRTAMKVAPPLS